MEFRCSVKQACNILVSRIVTGYKLAASGDPYRLVFISSYTGPRRQNVRKHLSVFERYISSAVRQEAEERSASLNPSRLPSSKGVRSARIDGRKPSRRRSPGVPCEHEGCSVKSPSFGFAADGTRRRCQRHRLPGMTNLRNCCEVPGCSTTASHNLPEERGAVRCSLHREPDMVNKFMPPCSVPGCSRIAWLGLPGGHEATHCVRHGEVGMVRIRYGRICVVRDCQGRPDYRALDSVGPATHCPYHKQPGMIPVTRKLCDHPDGCVIKAQFGFSGLPPQRCFAHKELGMVSSIRKTCREEECYQRAVYGAPGEGPTWCSEHRKEGMVTDPKRRCLAQDCTELARYAFASDWRATKCQEHREEGMVRHYKIRCGVEGCRAFASCAGVGEWLPVRCWEHREPGMARLKRRL